MKLGWIICLMSICTRGCINAPLDPNIAPGSGLSKVKVLVSTFFLPLFYTQLFERPWRAKFFSKLADKFLASLCPIFMFPLFMLSFPNDIKV